MLVDSQISLGDNESTLKNTLFGWIACGKLTTKFPIALMTCNLAIEAAEESVHTTLRIWEIEDYVNKPSKLTEEEEACRHYHLKNHLQAFFVSRRAMRL